MPHRFDDHNFLVPKVGSKNNVIQGKFGGSRTMRQFYRNGTPKFDKIDKGESICKIIKRAYFHDEGWASCGYKVAAMFSELKASTKAKYAEMNENEILDLLSNYSIDDVLDTFSA